MSSESAFNKRLTNESTMDKVEGLLEHFNLPPKVIDFIRRHQKLIRIIIAVIVIIVVSWSLYGSHIEKVREEAASALSLARQADSASQAEAFKKVYQEYGSTSSALWAKVELAHMAMKDGSFADASTQYTAILGEVEEASPLYPLILFSLAQALEGEKKYQDASGRYDLLKGMKGFEYLAYSGLGRLEEAQDNVDKAIAVYNNFLLTIADDPAFDQARMDVEARVSRLKARQ